MLWMLIFSLALAFIVAGVVLTLLKVQAGFRPPDQGDRLADREVEAMRAENEELKQRIAELTERLTVLERIATDPAERVSREIEELR
jgi:cell division protein FtsB